VHHYTCNSKSRPRAYALGRPFFKNSLSSSSAEFWDLTELYEFVVSNSLDDSLELSCALHVAALYASCVTLAANFLYNTGTLRSLLKASDDVSTALVIILGYLNVGGHMWARAYHVPM